MFVFNAEYQKLIMDDVAMTTGNDRWVFVLTKSPMNIRIGTISVRGKAGQFCLLSPGQQFWLAPEGEFAIVDWAEFSLSVPETELLRTLPIAVNEIVTPPNWPDLSALVRSISITFDSADTWRQEKMSGFLKVLLYGIASGETAEAGKGSASDQQYARLLRLRRKLSDHLDAHPTVKEAAEEAGLSISRFEFLYQKYFGISFINDLIRLRIRRSCVLLCTTDWTVARIADALGYENESNYYRQFRKLIGVSPAVYRRINFKIT